MPDHQETTAQWSVGNLVHFGRQNDGQPLQWLVLRAHDDYRLLLCAECVAQRRIGKLSTSSWKNSELRQWLNESFLFEVFSLDEQQLLCQMNGDFVTLLDHDEAKHFQPLPDCTSNENLSWWLCSCSKDSDNDTWFDTADHSDAHIWFSSKRPNDTACVRPVIVISLTASQTAISRNAFHYYNCPFCGTKNSNFKSPCTCCDFSPERHYNMQHGAHKGTGCLSAVCIGLLIPLGALFIMFGGPIGIIMFAIIFVAAMSGLIKMALERTETQKDAKYENESDHPILLHTCQNDHERTAAIYHNAGLLQKNASGKADFTHAANMYTLIPDYQDAAIQKEACLKAADRLSSTHI